ncbi:DUF1538 domain-containing protein [uncultured Sphaerochaeta sp.]|uniref:DUF1538 domain-containing protein n=1 Tax=uncultured Sphaerochaeta sp. TaxID=886478 RepID=UPI002A0A71A9|nr:DUF1538 domain-containing protein [uncultured Sphaerochaeta sp.]
MELLRKLKEVSISIIPICLLVTLLHFTISPLSESQLLSFYLGSVFVILGLALFLVGTEIGLLPIGEKIGSVVTGKKNLPLLIFTGVIIGFVITFAEPDISVLASQVQKVNSSISPLLLITLIALGVGLFVTLGMLRVLFALSLKKLLIMFYTLIFILAFFSNPSLSAIAFDSGGATTGPMAVPFIMALGLGIARIQKRQNEADTFGFIALASIGPILGVLVLGLFKTNADMGSVSQSMASYETNGFIHLFPEMAGDVAKALTPLVLICALFQVTLVKMPVRQVFKMVMGILYSYIGLVVFFVGAQGGFMPVGYTLGSTLSAISPSLLIGMGFVLGAITVIAEPAVWVLVDQVETISNGHIRKTVMLVAMAIGVSLSIGLSLLRIVTGLSLWYFLLPGYVLALILMRWCPPLFSAMAFDSGGVASGPLSSTFILSFAIGASTGLGGNPATDAFGVIALVAMTPLVTIQLLGLLYKKKQAKMENKGEVRK